MVTSVIAETVLFTFNDIRVFLRSTIDVLLNYPGL
jgi:hypothetical protein